MLMHTGSKPGVAGAESTPFAQPPFCAISLSLGAVGNGGVKKAAYNIEILYT